MTTVHHKQGLAVGQDTVLSVEFWIYDTQGELLDESDGVIEFLYQGQDNLLPKLNEALKDQHVGFENTFHLEPEDAFGDYDADLLRVEPRSMFPEPVEVGMQFEGIPTGPDGEASEEDSLLFTVTDLTDDTVILDGNHPFAGMALRVRVKIVDIRQAAPEEIEQGYAHGNEEDEDENDDAMLDEFLETVRKQRGPGEGGSTLH